MAGKRQRQNGAWEFKFQRKSLFPKAVYFTFDTDAEGDAYAARVEPLLDRGIVPTEFTGTCLETLADLCAYYQAQATHSKSDEDVLRPLQDALRGVAMTRLTYSWVEGWVETMKASLKPSTLTKRVGLLARVVDWGMRRELINLPNNPLRLLPKGYATSGVDRNQRYSGERDRRLQKGEEAAIRKVLRAREEVMLFDMALETGMRMSEMITLTTQQVDLERRTIFLEKTKNGSKRQVPMSSVLHLLLGEFLGSLEPGSPHVFSWGNLPVATARNRVSHLFASRFERAGCPDLRFHDLRREATSRFFERTTLTDTEIAKITGHRDPRMLLRYSNLRASTLSTKLW